jgi:hypothetical protein
MSVQDIFLAPNGNRFPSQKQNKTKAVAGAQIRDQQG